MSYTTFAEQLKLHQIPNKVHGKINGIIANGTYKWPFEIVCELYALEHTDGLTRRELRTIKDLVLEETCPSLKEVYAIDLTIDIAKFLKEQTALPKKEALENISNIHHILKLKPHVIPNVRDYCVLQIERFSTIKRKSNFLPHMTLDESMNAFEQARWGDRTLGEMSRAAQFERMSNGEIAEAIERTYFETEMLNQELELEKIEIRSSVEESNLYNTETKRELAYRTTISQQLRPKIKEYTRGKAYLKALAAYVSLKGLDPVDI